ncbi:hypothetical protein CEQ90_18275 [Lewinellaceae bacterium SD302]|nr:hypothetical protein CEQ90_18275 [Lewinellaceae bacterium SD302]
MSVKWIAKAVVQKAISFLPNPESVNLLFQRYVTKGVELSDEHFGFKIAHARDHINYFREHFGEVPAGTANILELGTGWYPIIPMSFYLTGLGSVTSVDIQDWLAKEGQLTTIRKMKAWDEAGKLRAYLPGFREDRWASLLQILADEGQHDRQSINESIGLTVLLEDARKLPFTDGNFDFICSNNTFEHVHADVLKGILREFKRLTKKGGLMSHFIDLSDHFAHFDHSITIYNFLRFSRKQWKLIDNNIQPQNRLRWKDYEAMYRELDIPISKTDVRQGDLELLASVPVHTEYAAYTPEELAISHGYVVSEV